MDIEDIIKSTIANAEECEAAQHTEKDFGEFMAGVLKDIFGDQVEFVKVKEVDDGKDDVHITINDKPRKMELDEDEQAVVDVVTEDEMEVVKHVVRKIAQQHKKEMPLEGIYSAVAARLAMESDKLIEHKQKARYEAQKAAQTESQVTDKFADFLDNLSDEEKEALVRAFTKKK